MSTLGLRSPRAHLLGGYLLYAASSVVEWLRLLTTAHHARRYIAFAALAMTASAGLFGLAWWTCSPLLEAAVNGARRARRALVLFAAASALSAIGDVTLLLLFRYQRPEGLVLELAGMLVAALGFVWASRRVGPMSSI
ncbi:MAG: hypothetical protein ACRDYZ_03480 [Acidimicrobiales bacterium]